LNRPHYIALGLVLLFTVVMLNLPGETTVRLKLGVGSVFLPLFGLAASSHQLTEVAANSITPRSELLRRNEALLRENQELKLQAIRTETVERENTRLRALVGWQQQQRWKFAVGRVILRDPANWWRTVQIDVGSRDGVRQDMPVIVPEGLVGRVSSVGLTRSQVVLLGDPNCKVAARVENESRSTGVIGPAGPLDRDLVELGFLSRTANLKPGQFVRTSGEGGIFPRDILIGTVVDSRNIESGLATVSRIKLAANLNSLDEVFVLLLSDERNREGKNP
jgi:rod shape-determining protein MreC